MIIFEEMQMYCGTNQIMGVMPIITCIGPILGNLSIESQAVLYVAYKTLCCIFDLLWTWK